MTTTPVRHFFATSAGGAEALLADEIAVMVADRDDAAVAGRQVRGGVSFEGPLELGYRVCLWSRLAQRVLLRLATVRLERGDAEALWRGVAAVDWSEHLSAHETLAVDFAGLGSAVGVANDLFGAQRVKDVIVDQFRERSGARPSVDLRRPDVRVNVYVGRGEATIGIDLSGESLHRRGYRTAGRQAEAPLKETLAAALLLRAGWPEVAAAGGSVVDPLCGSGTLPIEAALMAADVAPGLLREAVSGGDDGPRWGFTGWRGHDAELWGRLLAQAGERRQAALARLRASRPLPLAFGFDRDPRAIALARECVARAGLEELVGVERADVAALQRPPALPADAPPGLVVTNPPYGQRLKGGNEAATGGRVTRADPALAELYAVLGARLLATFPDWRAAILVADLELGKRLGLRAHRSNRFMNGPIPVTLLRMRLDEASRWMPAPTASGRTEALGTTVALGAPSSLSPAAEQFANRLRRNARHWGRLMRRAGITCYRVYDADLPDFALAIDRYERWVHVQEYAAPPQIDPAKAQARLDEAMRVIPEVLEVEPGDVFLKVRERQRGAAQYQRRAAPGAPGEEREVHEGDLAFLVNFTDYLDTGLFLPGRKVRGLLRELAPGQVFLNLFGYTGAASVAAGKGGAKSTTTVDLSARYLAWAGRNLALNKLHAARNELVEADVLQWVAQHDGSYGLIYLDPPTFSNSKKMGRATFDVRRDHADLIRLVARRLLAPAGVLVFACNARRFTMDVDALSDALRLDDLSRATLPPDFARRARSHHVWRISAG